MCPVYSLHVDAPDTRYSRWKVVADSVSVIVASTASSQEMESDGDKDGIEDHLQLKPDDAPPVEVRRTQEEARNQHEEVDAHFATHAQALDKIQAHVEPAHIVKAAMYRIVVHHYQEHGDYP